MSPGNGYDEARLVPYKYDLRRVSARLYERSSVTGAAVYRDSFVVRDTAGNYWCYYRVSATNPAETYARPRFVTHNLRSNEHFQIVKIQNGPLAVGVPQCTLQILSRVTCPLRDVTRGAMTRVSRSRVPSLLSPPPTRHLQLLLGITGNRSAQ